MYPGGKAKKRPSTGYAVTFFLALFLVLYITGYYYFGVATEKPNATDALDSVNIRGGVSLKDKLNEDSVSQKSANSALMSRPQHRAMHPDGVDDTVTAIIECSTTSGNLTIDIRSGWAPKGVQRFFELIKIRFFDNLPFFRVCPRYISNFSL